MNTNKERKKNQVQPKRYSFWNGIICKWIDRISNKFFGIKPIEETHLLCWRISLFIIALIFVICSFLSFLAAGIAGVVYLAGLVLPQGKQLENGYPKEIEKSNFNDNKWQESLGVFLRDNNDQNYFALNQEKDRALLKFYKNILERQEINFEFIPLSENAANIVINVNDLYEIVIGDNDYESLTLKLRESWKGVFKEVESVDGYTRKPIDLGIKKKTNVLLTMNTECHLDGSYFVEIGIKFTPEKIKTDKPKTLHAQYNFNPPFQTCIPLEISVGLINTEQTYVAARFISFSINEN